MVQVNGNEIFREWWENHSKWHDKTIGYPPPHSEYRLAVDAWNMAIERALGITIIGDPVAFIRYKMSLLKVRDNKLQLGDLLNLHNTITQAIVEIQNEIDNSERKSY